jgi:hypothetical protein
VSLSSGDAVFSRFGRHRDLIRPWFRRFAISTSLSRTEVIERVRGIVEPESHFRACFSRTNKLFAGEVSATGFKVRQIRPLRIPWNSWSPVLLGTLETQPTGTRVGIIVRPTRLASVLLLLWFAIAIAFVNFAPTLSRQRTGSLPALAGVEILTVVLAGYLLMTASFSLRARKARELLEEALQTEPTDRVRQVLEGRSRRLPRFLKPLGTMVTIFVLMFFLARMFIVRSEPYQVALGYLGANSTIHEELGTLSKIAPGWHSDKIVYGGPEGRATFGLDVSGTRGTGVVFLALSKHLGVWKISSAELHEPSGRVVTLEGR